MKKIIIIILSLLFLSSCIEILYISDSHEPGSGKLEIYSIDDKGRVRRETTTGYYHFIAGMDRLQKYIVASRVEADTNGNNVLDDGDKKSLWIIDYETKEETRLIGAPHNAESKSIYGDWIVFLMTKGGEDQTDIYLIRRDTPGIENAVNLTNTPNKNEGDPVFSFDGKEILYSSLEGDSKENARFVLKRMSLATKEIITVFDPGPKGVWIGEYFPPGAYDCQMSPDKQWIVFESPVFCTPYEMSGAEGCKPCKENFGSGIWHIFKVRNVENSTEIIDLSKAGGHPFMAEYLPSFNSDGDEIVFSAYFESTNNPQNSLIDIFTMDTNGGSLKRLTYGNGANNKYAIAVNKSFRHRTRGRIKKKFR